MSDRLRKVYINTHVVGGRVDSNWAMEDASTSLVLFGLICKENFTMFIFSESDSEVDNLLGGTEDPTFTSTQSTSECQDPGAAQSSTAYMELAATKSEGGQGNHAAVGDPARGHLPFPSQ